MFENQNYDDEIFKGVVFKNKTLIDVEFLECQFIECDLSETLFKNCVFKSCHFKDCDLSLIKVDHSIFKDVDFSNTKAVGINWAVASINSKEVHQLLNSISFINCVINYSNFLGLELENIRIEKCVAHEVDFSEANFKKGSFRGTDLQQSIFRKTNLEKVNFIGATNYYISPTTNNLNQAKFAMPEALSLLHSMDINIIDYPENENS